MRDELLQMDGAFIANNVCWLEIKYSLFAVQARPHHGTEDPNSGWATKLGQSLQEASREEEGTSDGLLLRASAAWQNIEAEVYSVRIRVQEGNVLKEPQL